MALILALETSSSVCSVALFQDQQLLALAELQLEKSHSSHSTVLIKQMLENCGYTFQNISAVAVSSGPGSYTGLRIGSAIAKGLCYALDIPLIEVSTLHALAFAHIQITPRADKYLFCPMLDARRMEVYTCIVNHNLQEQLPVSPVVLNAASFQEFLTDHNIIFFGSGSTKFEAITAISPQAIFVPALPLSARQLVPLAFQKFLTQQFEDTAYYEPFYLKEVYITTGTK